MPDDSSKPLVTNRQIERAGIAIAKVMVCGLTLRSAYSGKEFRALCDDPGAPSEVRHETCECREAAKAALEAAGVNSQ